MPKKPVFDVIKKVVSVLSEEPKSVLEISKEAGVSWESAKKTLELLEEIGVVARSERGFYIGGRVKESGDTYFKVYIDPDQKKRAQALLNLIYRTWEEATGSHPGPIFAQKIAVEVANKFSLDVPIVRYKFGRFIPMDVAEEEYPFPPEVVAYIKELVDRFSKFSVHELLEHVYSAYDEKVYLLKEKILVNLYRGALDETLERALWDLIIELDEKELRDYVARYLGLIQPFIGKEAPKPLLMLLRAVFEVLWDYIALSFFKKDYSGYYPGEVPVNLIASLVETRQILEDVLTDATNAVDLYIEEQLKN